MLKSIKIEDIPYPTGTLCGECYNEYKELVDSCNRKLLNTLHKIFPDKERITVKDILCSELPFYIKIELVDRKEYFHDRDLQDLGLDLAQIALQEQNKKGNLIDTIYQETISLRRDSIFLNHVDDKLLENVEDIRKIHSKLLMDNLWIMWNKQTDMLEASSRCILNACDPNFTSYERISNDFRNAVEENYGYWEINRLILVAKEETVAGLTYGDEKNTSTYHK